SLSDDEDSMKVHDEKKDELPDNYDAESVVGDDFENVFNLSQEVHSPKNDAHNHNFGEKEFQDRGDMGEKPKDSDPFNLEPLIMKTCHKDAKATCSMTPTFPSGFSQKVNGDLQDKHVSVCNQGDQVVDSESIQNHSKDNFKTHFGFSMIERLEETIKVGLALGFNMEGCENTLASLIVENGDIKVNQ
ncbi:hypothetical protein Tco_0161423, partial [Tanacetum coccineum]